MHRQLRVALVLTLAGCAAESTSLDAVVVGSDGKADNFLSLTAQEYVVEGRATVTLEEEYREMDEASRLERVRELVGYKQILIAWFLTQYLIEKKHDDSNYGYGGYEAMAKANTYDELDVRQEEDLTYSFAVQQLVAGDANLIAALPTRMGENGEHEFTLIVGNPSNEEMARLETNHEWYRSAPWDGFDPDELDASKKAEVVFTIRREVESSDAWFDFNELFADGKLTIDVHMGWDYHNDYHVVHSRSLFDWLRQRGFVAPVQSFADLGRESGAFTKTLRANGHDVEVQVRIFYGRSGADTDPNTDAGGRQLEDDMRESLRTQDVIVYSGHSGPFYGFALANWRQTAEGDLDDSEMSEVEMPSERYQIIVAEGCDTYHIGEAFRRNPAKPDGRYIDIITTTAPSNASSASAVQDIIGRLIEVDSSGSHRPRTMKSLLTDLDGNSAWFHTMYGIHGIDDNPQVHPYGVLENLCQPCGSDVDCGGLGNRCAALGGSGVCVVSCTIDAACPSGYSCQDIGSASIGVINDSACVPTSLQCE